LKKFKKSSQEESIDNDKENHNSIKIAAMIKQIMILYKKFDIHKKSMNKRL